MKRHAQRLCPQGLYHPWFEHDACGVGFVCHVKGERSHDIIQKGLQILQNLTHRGACGCDPLTGDGAGLLIQVPDEFLRQACKPLRIELPEPGKYGVGMVFLPRDVRERNFCLKSCEKIIKEEGQKFLGWRPVPVDKSAAGPLARQNMPEIRQIFVAAAFAAVGPRGDLPSTLELIRTVPLPGVVGRFDHFAVDIKAKRLFVAALGNDTLEVVDLADRLAPHRFALMILADTSVWIEYFRRGDSAMAGEMDRLLDEDGLGQSLQPFLARDRRAPPVSPGTGHRGRSRDGGARRLRERRAHRRRRARGHSPADPRREPRWRDYQYALPARCTFG